jgi:serine/threonine protein kinase
MCCFCGNKLEEAVAASVVATEQCQFCSAATIVDSVFCMDCGAWLKDEPPALDGKTGVMELKVGANDNGASIDLPSEGQDFEGATQMTATGLIIKQRWHLSKILGKGGMGIVYCGDDIQTGDSVAVKIMTKELAGDELLLARFQREGKGLESLAHTNIVRCYDFGQDAGHYYLVMERVDGLPLDILHQKNKPMPYVMVCNIAEQVLCGLKYLHDQGWVHRDLKTANIMVTQDHIAKILDFGLVKLGGESDGGEQHTQLTQAHCAFGTPQYMAPEQCMDAKNVDGRADLYSLGVIMYELITGVLPFNEGGPLQIMQAQLGEHAAPMRSFRGDCPPELENIIMKLMAKTIDDRFESAQHVIEEIQSFLAGSQNDMGLDQTQISPLPAEDIPGMAGILMEGAAPSPAGYLTDITETDNSEPGFVAEIDQDTQYYKEGSSHMFAGDTGMGTQFDSQSSSNKMSWAAAAGIVLAAGIGISVWSSYPIDSSAVSRVESTPIVKKSAEATAVSSMTDLSEASEESKLIAENENPELVVKNLVPKTANKIANKRAKKSNKITAKSIPQKRSYKKKTTFKSFGDDKPVRRLSSNGRLVNSLTEK